MYIYELFFTHFTKLSTFLYFYMPFFWLVCVRLSKLAKGSASQSTILLHQYLITNNQLKQCTKCTILLADEVFSYPKTLQNYAQQANNQKQLDINILQQNSATCARIAYSVQKYGRVSNFRFSRHFKFRKSRAKHRFCAFERISSSSF